MNALTPWFTDFSAFLQMGKHGVYVWPAFGVSALALAWEWWGQARQARRLRALTVAGVSPLTPLRQAQGRPSLSPEGRGSEDPALPSDLLPLPLGEGRGEGNPR